MNVIERREILDEEHLRLLRIGYFVVGGTAAFMAVFGLFYAALGVLIAVSAPGSARAGQAPPEFLGFMLLGSGLLIIAAAGTYTALAFLTARAIQGRRSRSLCLVTAGLSCVYVPFGTVLGVFTFNVLGRPSVRAMFGGGARPPLPAPPRGTPVPPPPPGPEAIETADDTAWRASPVLGVPNVRQAAEYYRDVLGFDLDPEAGVFQPTSDDPGGVYAIVKRSGSWLHLQIRRAPQEARARPAFERDAYLYAAGLDRLYEELRTRGARILEPPHDTPYGLRELVVEDLNGYRVTFGEFLG